MAPPKRKQRAPFNIVRIAMWLIAVIVITGCLITLMTAIRCLVWTDAYCADRTWGQTVREFLGETLAVLVAIAMGWRAPPPPPEDKP
jgi:hypothetical protein